MSAIASPELLRPDNFTPPQRTPWGGRKLIDVYKRGLDLSAAVRAYAVVGESWEMACGAEFPSLVRRTNQPLAALIAAQPKSWLGSDRQPQRAYGPAPRMSQLRQSRRHRGPGLPALRRGP